jgi:predicted GNAT family N-acyltransferase
MNNEKMNITTTDYHFFLSVNSNKKPLLKKKITQQLSKINISNLLILDDDNQYNSTVEEVQSARLFPEYTFCKNIHIDDIDAMFDKAHILLEIRLDDNTIAGFSLIDLEMKDKHTYIHLLCANSNYKKVGTELINMVKEITTQLGYNEIQLHTVTDAIEFYKRLNFKCYKDSCMLERVKSGKIVVVNTETSREFIERGYECPDNQCLMVYKIRGMNLNGGRSKTMKRRRKNC